MSFVTDSMMNGFRPDSRSVDNPLHTLARGSSPQLGFSVV